MSSIAGDRLLGRILGILIAAAALTACGGGTSGSTSASGSTATPSTGSSSSSGASATVVALSAPVYTVAPSAAAVVTINRSGSSTAAATVGYTTINGTAVAGSDYVATSGSVTWQAGETGAKAISIPVTNAASGKDFGFALTSVSGQADFGSPATATIGVNTAASTSSSSSGGSSTAGGSSSSGSSSSSGTSGTFNPAYPRLATAFIAPIFWNSSLNTAWTNWLASMAVNLTSVIAGQGWSMYGGSFQAAVAQVKSLSSIGSKIFEYYFSASPNSRAPYFENGLPAPYIELISFPSWWAWPDALAQGSGTNGVASSDGLPYTNCTIGALPSGSSQLLNGGLYWEQWVAKYNYDFWIGGSEGAASTDVAANLDGLYHDNWGAVPPLNFDYNFSGSAPSAGTSDANFRSSYGEGMASGGTWLTSNTSKLFLGNIGAWYPSGATIGAMSQVANGGLIEGMVGVSYSPDNYSGTSAALSQYAQAISDTISPNLVIVGHNNINANGSDALQSTAYAAMRYGLTLALQNNGYYFAAEGQDYDWVVLPFDEYWVNPSTGVACPYSTAASVAACQGYMGQPTSSWGGISGSGATQSIDGLNVRMFYNAATGTTWVAINAPHNSGGTGGGPYTISATSLHAGSAGFKMISGTQDTSVNNGATVSSITIPTGYDGRIVQLL
jgi:hypothetical protein